MLIRRFSERQTVNGSPPRMSRLLSHFRAGFFWELQWKRIKHDKMDDKATEGWFQFDNDLDLAKGRENQYIVIG